MPRPRRSSTRNHRRRVWWLAIAASSALVVSACSDSGGNKAERATTTTTTASAAPTTTTEPGGAAPEDRACDRAVEAAPAVAPVPGAPDDRTMTSFDGAKIRLHWFPTSSATKDHPAPTVLMGPGWGQAGALDKANNAPDLFGGINVHALRTAGYNVLTWDPRGWGKSTGTVTVDGPDEVHDVSRILDWLATQPGVQVDGKGDPRAGMVGGSYGGGIQLVTAAADCRVDAIVPTIAWHSLGTSLYRNDTFKQGWSNFLTSITKGHDVDPHITSSSKEANATGRISDANLQWFADRGPADAVAKITAPTLLLQGTVDTLFTLDEAIANVEALQKAGTPVAMIWFCGGHGYCATQTKPGDPTAAATLAWLDRYVRGDRDAELPSGFEWIEADGTTHDTDKWPPTPGTPLSGNGSGTLAMKPTGGAGPDRSPTPGQPLGGIAALISPTKATNAVNIAVPAKEATTVLGAPTLELTYTAQLPANANVPRPPDRVFAQVVGPDGKVVGHQITPVPVTFDGKPHTTKIELETIVMPAKADTSFTVQLVSATPAYFSAVQVGTVHVADASVTLPTVTDLDGGATSRT